MLTIKLKLKNPIDISDYMKQYTNVSHFAYNRLLQGHSLSKVEKIIKTTMNNIPLMNADFIKVATNQVKNLISKSEIIIFGGKKNWHDYNQGLITKEEYQNKKLMPIMVRGTIHDNKGNRKFELDIDNHQVIFKPKKGIKIKVDLPTTRQDKILKQLQSLCELHEAYFTCSLSNEYIWITYDESIFQNKNYKFIKNRIAAIDLNPNYIALVVRDNNKIIHKEILGLYHVNQMSKYKKQYEDYEIGKRLVKIAEHYRCEYFAYEKLEIKSSDKGKGKKFNKICNSWRRKRLIESINKRCGLINIKIQPIVAAYSSFIGQMDNLNDYDSIAAAIEISNRCLLYIKKYKEGDESIKSVTRINNKVNLNIMDRWKKKLCLNNTLTYKQLYKKITESKYGYRFLFPYNKVFCFRMSSYKSNVFVHIC